MGKLITVCMVFLVGLSTGCVDRVSDGDDPDDDSDVGDDDTDGTDDDVVDDDTAMPDDDDSGATDDDDDSSAARNWSWGWINTVVDADASLVGEMVNDSAGGNVHTPGDMNGDGIDELAIGAFRKSELAYRGGKVYVVLGRDQGWSIGESLGPHPSVVGEYENMELSATHRVGDVNGDGLADLAIDRGFQNGAPPGGQYILLGRTSGWSCSVPVESVDVTVHNLNASGGTDFSTRSFLGDFDGDGLDDWLLGGPALFNGEAHVISGADMAQGLMAPDDSLVWAYAGTGDSLYYYPAGDINGDDLADFYGYQLTTSQALQVLFGRTTGFPHDQEFRSVADLRIEDVGGAALIGVKNLGDVDGDGLQDLGVTGALGGLFIFLGRTNWPATISVQDADVRIASSYPISLGESPGDIDADGLPDLIIRAPNPAISPSNMTDAYIYFGRGSWPASLGLSDADVWIEPSSELGVIELYTWYDQHRGDLDGDGITDLFVFNDAVDVDGVVDVGLVKVFVGRTSWPSHLSSDDADVTFSGTEISQSMGMDRMSLVADLDGDGRDDLVIASGSHPTHTLQGETFVFFGQPR